MYSNLYSSQVVKIFNLFITYGDTFLPNPSTYDELYYELIRMQKVFEDVYLMGVLVCLYTCTIFMGLAWRVCMYVGVKVLRGHVWEYHIHFDVRVYTCVFPVSLSPFAMPAKRCSSPDTHSEYHSSAGQLASNLVNVRSIAAHFHPKINTWSASHQITSITPEQVQCGTAEPLIYNLPLNSRHVTVSFQHKYVY